MHIGFFGGTFDPAHLGHLYVAQQVLSAVGLQRIAFMPSARPPHKDTSTLSSAEDRVAMLRLLLEGHPEFELSFTELQNPALQYSVDTLAFLREQYPQDTLYFIIGGDSLMYIEKWYQAPRLLRENRFISVFRPGSAAQTQAEMAEKLCRQYAAQITLVECPGYDVSSTLIRQKAAAQEELAPYTGEAVAAYIREKRLYL